MFPGEEIGFFEKIRFLSVRQAAGCPGSVPIYRQGERAVIDGQEELMRKVVVKTRSELDRWFKDRHREAFLFSKNRIFIKALLG